MATATKTLADGSKQKYFYAWRGGPMLKSDDGKPLQPNDPQFVVARSASSRTDHINIARAALAWHPCSRYIFRNSPASNQ